MSPAATTAAAFQTQAAPVQNAPRLQPNRETELFFGKTKGDKTMGKNDREFLAASGFEIADQVSRIDDFRLIDGPDFRTIGVRAFEIKATDLVENIADGVYDCAIVGMDVLREFNLASRGQKGRMNVVPVANLDMAPCALAVAVGENSGIKTIEDLNGKTIVTKYPASVAAWARKNKIEFARIMKRNGGIESYGVTMPGVVIADMVESGGSLAVNGWRILGMGDNAWNAIKTGARKFSDMSVEDMESIDGVITPSRAMLVRSPRKMSAEKEEALRVLTERFVGASKKLGNSPTLTGRRVAEQVSYKAGRKITVSRLQAPERPTWR